MRYETNIIQEELSSYDTIKIMDWLYLVKNFS